MFRLSTNAGLRMIPVLAALALPGCSPGNGGSSHASADRQVTRGLDRSEAFLAESPSSSPTRTNTPREERPAALINDSALTFDQLRPALLEAAGGPVLEEAALDVLLDSECRALNIPITPDLIQAERAQIVRTMTRDEIARSEEEAERLVVRLRRDRGLGDTRFAALLRRNAMMRAIVRPEVRITPAALEQARSLRFGQRYRLRLITTATLQEASAAAQRISAGEPFSIVAADVSTDASADRGGLLDPVSPADAAYPAAIRTTMRQLAPGQLSTPLALDGSFALITLDAILPPLSPPPSTPSEEASALVMLEEDVRTQQERLLMNQLARRLLTGAKITVLDRTLDAAWRARIPDQPAR